MKIFAIALAFAASVMVSSVASAQTAVTATCADGSTLPGTSPSGACRGHGGVAAFAAPGTPSPAPTPAPVQAAKPAPTATTIPRATAATPAAGGGAGVVWLNTKSNFYHCQGDRYYGNTKNGSYMTEVDAKARGGRPDHYRPCGS